MALRIVTPPEGWSQAKQRAIGVFYDQHKSSTYAVKNAETGETEYPFLDGRPWWADIEKSTGMPVGPLYPMGWGAPWIPPVKYINESIGRIDARGRIVQNATMQLRWFRIDYVTMKKEYTEAMQSYYRLAVEEASRLNLPIPDYGDVIPFKLKAIIGPPPMSPKIPEAAEGGNPWLLGMAVANVYDRATGKMVVEEDETLARLLRAPNETLLTGEQLQRKAEEKESTAAAMTEVLEQMRAMQAELAAMREAERERKAAEAAKQQAAVERMANARAAKKKQPTPAGV